MIHMFLDFSWEAAQKNNLYVFFCVLGAVMCFVALVRFASALWLRPSCFKTTAGRTAQDGSKDESESLPESEKWRGEGWGREGGRGSDTIDGFPSGTIC